MWSIDMSFVRFWEKTLFQQGKSTATRFQAVASCRSRLGNLFAMCVNTLGVNRETVKKSPICAFYSNCFICVSLLHSLASDSGSVGMWTHCGDLFSFKKMPVPECLVESCGSETTIYCIYQQWKISPRGSVSHTAGGMNETGGALSKKRKVSKGSEKTRTWMREKIRNFGDIKKKSVQTLTSHSKKNKTKMLLRL